MKTTLVIIQLQPDDAYRVLALVQREATNGPIWNDYWQDLANQIAACLEQQRNGQFFQCEACKQ